APSGIPFDATRDRRVSHSFRNELALRKVGSRTAMRREELEAQLVLQRASCRGEGAGAVADLVLFRHRQFGQRLAEIRQPEDRVVAEASLAARRGQDPAVDAALVQRDAASGDTRREVAARAPRCRDRDDAAEARRAPRRWNSRELAQQLGDVVGEAALW